MMFSKVCRHEPDVLAAATSGRVLGPEQQAHVASCASCQDAIAMANALAPLGTSSGDAHRMPDAAVIWWKAQLLRRWEAERRVAIPLDRMHRAEIGVGLASLGIFIAWQWAGLGRILSLFDPVTLSALSGSRADWSPNMLVVAVAALALGIGIMVGIHRKVMGTGD